MSNSVNRINAEADLRALSVTAAATSEKSFKNAHEGLQREMGDVYKKPERKMVQEGLKKLRDLHRRMMSQG